MQLHERPPGQASKRRRNSRYLGRRSLSLGSGLHRMTWQVSSLGYLTISLGRGNSTDQVELGADHWKVQLVGQICPNPGETPAVPATATRTWTAYFLKHEEWSVPKESPKQKLCPGSTHGKQIFVWWILVVGKYVDSLEHFLAPQPDPSLGSAVNAREDLAPRNLWSLCRAQGDELAGWSCNLRRSPLSRSWTTHQPNTSQHYSLADQC